MLFLIALHDHQTVSSSTFVAHDRSGSHQTNDRCRRSPGPTPATYRERKKLEHELNEVHRKRFAEIFERVGPNAEKHWRKVMPMLSEKIEF